MSKNRDDDYEVGYGKPPKNRQFKPGQSGNPKGRPKSARNRHSYVKKVLNEPVTARVDGKTKRISRAEAAVRSVYAQALAGKPYAIKQVLEWIKENEPQHQRQYVVQAPPNMTMEEWEARYSPPKLDGMDDS